MVGGCAGTASTTCTTQGRRWAPASGSSSLAAARSFCPWCVAAGQDFTAQSFACLCTIRNYNTYTAATCAARPFGCWLQQWCDLPSVHACSYGTSTRCGASLWRPLSWRWATPPLPQVTLHVPFAAAVSSCSWSFLSSSLSSSVLTSNEVPSGLLWRRQPAAKWYRLFTCAGLALHAGKQPGIHYNTDGLSTADAVLSGFNSLGIIVRDQTGCLGFRV